MKSRFQVLKLIISEAAMVLVAWAWFPEGVTRAEEFAVLPNVPVTYREGEIHGRGTVLKDGQPFTGTQSWRSGPRVLEERRFVNGKPQGIWKAWYVSGAPKAEWAYEQGFVPNDKIRHWDEAGQDVDRLFVVGGLATGFWDNGGQAWASMLHAPMKPKANPPVHQKQPTEVDRPGGPGMAGTKKMDLGFTWRPDKDRLIVAAVRPSSPAAEGNFEAGDEICAIKSRAVHTLKEFQEGLSIFQPGSKVKVEVASPNDSNGPKVKWLALPTGQSSHPTTALSPYDPGVPTIGNVHWDEGASDMVKTPARTQTSLKGNLAQRICWYGSGKLRFVTLDQDDLAIDCREWEGEGLDLALATSLAIMLEMLMHLNQLAPFWGAGPARPWTTASYEVGGSATACCNRR